jgi:hypothetical protein
MIADEQSHIIILDAFRFIAQVVSALVDCHDIVVFGQSIHLFSPRVPEVGKAVDHHDQCIFLVAERCVVNLHAVAIGVAVFDACLDIAAGGENRRK